MSGTKAPSTSITITTQGTYVTGSGVSTVLTDISGLDNTIRSQGTDTIYAGMGSDTVYASGAMAQINPGAGSLVLIGGGGVLDVALGAGSVTLYGGTGNSSLVGGVSGNNVLVAGSGNTSLLGGAASLMYGNNTQSSFVSSTNGFDTMVGGGGVNTFDLTNTTGLELVFGGITGPNTFSITGGSTVVLGSSHDVVNFNEGRSTVPGAASGLVFDGPQPATFNISLGGGGAETIVNFKPSDTLNIAGMSSTQVSQLQARSGVGSGVSILNLSDGGQITLFSVPTTT